MQKKNTTL